MSNLCNPVDYSMPGSPIRHYLLKLAQIHVHWVASNHLILCCPLLLLPSFFPNIKVFPMDGFFTSGGKSAGASGRASILSSEYSGLISFQLTGLILQFQILSRVFSITPIQKHQFFSAQSSLWFSHICIWLLEKP